MNLEDFRAAHRRHMRYSFSVSVRLDVAYVKLRFVIEIAKATSRLCANAMTRSACGNAIRELRKTARLFLREAVWALLCAGIAYRAGYPLHVKA